jgi:MFS family permease
MSTISLSPKTNDGHNSRPSKAQTSAAAWLTVIFGCFVLMVSNGLTLTGLTVFDSAFLKEFSWSRGELKFRDFITYASAGIMAPVFGALADKYGSRLPIVFGLLCLAGGYFGYAYIHSLTAAYFLHVLLGIGLAASGFVVVVLMVSKWFEQKRGLALGLALMGSSLGNSLFPAFNSSLIAATGWRQAMSSVGVVPLVLACIVFFGLKEVKTARAASNNGSFQSLVKSPESLGSVYSAFKNVRFWSLGFIGMFSFFVIVGLTSNLFLYLRDQGLDAASASKGIGAVFMLGLIGKFVFGYLSDVWGQQTVFRVVLGLMLVGCLSITFHSSGPTFLYLSILGLGWGGLYTSLQIVTVQQFGTESAGKILGAYAVLEALGGGLGPWLTGLLYDKTGQYQVPFGLMCGLLLVSLGIALRLKRGVKKGAILSATRSESSVVPAK